MGPLKILHIGKYYHPFPGGMERVLKELCEGFVNEGHEVHCMVSHQKSKNEVDVINGVNVYRLPTLGTLASNPLTLWSPKLVERINPDVIHFHVPNPLSQQALLTGKRPTVVTYHADIQLPKWTDKIYRTHLNFTLSRAHKIVVASQKLLNSKQLDTTRHLGKLEIIPFGISEDRFIARRPWIETQMNPVPDVLFVGRLTHYKGLAVLIKAMKNVKHKLVIIGSGPLEQEIKTLVNKWNLQDRVFLLGYQPDEVVIDYLQRTKAIVLPSTNRSEAFGISLLEAMACGKPLITADLNTGVTDLNIHKQTGLVVPPENSVELAGAINSLLENPKLLHDLGRAAREHFETNYRQNRMVDRHLDLYRSFID